MGNSRLAFRQHGHSYASQWEVAVEQRYSTNPRHDTCAISQQWYTYKWTYEQTGILHSL